MWDMTTTTWATTRSVASPPGRGASKEACCADSRNDCQSVYGDCYDQTASDDFLFGLWMPGRTGGEGPERYLTTGKNTGYQFVGPDYWPWWGINGVNDLGMGYNAPPGSNAQCTQGHTYAGSPNQICGGHQNWVATQLEVWRPACTSCGGHGACNRITRVCACAAGYVLSNLATCVADPCYEKTCSGHGSCDPYIHPGACICDLNYRGSDCSEGRGPSPLFPGTELIAAEWGEALSGWSSSSVPEVEWTLCYSSFAEDATTRRVPLAVRCVQRDGERGAQRGR